MLTELLNYHTLSLLLLFMYVCIFIYVGEAVFLVIFFKFYLFFVAVAAVIYSTIDLPIYNIYYIFSSSIILKGGIMLGSESSSLIPVSSSAEQFVCHSGRSTH